VFPNTLSKPMKPIDPRNRLGWFVGFVLKKQLWQLGTENRERETVGLLLNNQQGHVSSLSQPAHSSIS